MKYSSPCRSVALPRMTTTPAMPDGGNRFGGISASFSSDAPLSFHASLSDGRSIPMKQFFVVSLVAAAVAFPAAAGAATFKGVVVSVQPTRHAMAVTQSNGVVRTVHARVLRQAGTRVSITAGRLRDGTFSAARVSALGRATKARIHGVVVRAVRGGYLLSAGGSVLRILSPTRHTASTGQTPLAPGTPVDATVSIGDDGLQAED